VTDAKKAAAALNWAVQEMERRYAVFATAGVRDIKRYNETVEGTGLPLILIIIDELADLMMAAPVDVENAICRLAQKARAAGLHLVLATQRPSVDVITGTIKANIPSRISFAVSSQIDSRTVLDMAGAEKLLGKGDMLFYPVGAAKPLRVQGAFISDSEVEELINYIKPQVEPEYTEEITTYAAAPAESGKEQELFEDELLEEAIRMVMETGQASASMLQRKFRIGYSRAGRLIDTMEEMKIVGPNMGSKPREILMSSDQINTLYFKE
jgi:S-DNA-T family DNA segregation ATPase FtsK/SpoIIIE